MHYLEISIIVCSESDWIIFKLRNRDKTSVVNSHQCDFYSFCDNLSARVWHRMTHVTNNKQVEWAAIKWCVLCTYNMYIICIKYTKHA
jgi:hypothetical protein